MPVVRCPDAQSRPRPHPHIREFITFVRMKTNCTLFSDFVDIALLRDFEDLKVIVQNPIDFPHTCENTLAEASLFIFTLKINSERHV